MKARFNTAAATVIAACFLSIAAGCGDEFWQGEKPAPPPAPKAQDFCVAEDGKAVDCDDKNACTDDTCDPKKGCAHANNKAACDDGNPCTSDVCKGGACAGTPNTVACDDGNVCTQGDKCKDGACVGTAVGQVFCDDGNPCTVDSCDPASGCTHKSAVTSPPFVCDDGNPCTEADSCQAGACTSGLYRAWLA